MLEIMPYEYWANLARDTYLDSSANLISVELNMYGDGTLYLINEGIHDYLKSIIDHNSWILPQLPLDNLRTHLYLGWFNVHPCYSPSAPFMLQEMALYFSWIHLGPEDFMAQSLWIFEEYENNTAVENFMSQSLWIFEEYEEVEDIMSEANWMFEESEVSNPDLNSRGLEAEEESEVSNPDLNSRGLEAEDIMSEANWMFEEE